MMSTSCTENRDSLREGHEIFGFIRVERCVQERKSRYVTLENRFFFIYDHLYNDFVSGNFDYEFNDIESARIVEHIGTKNMSGL